MHGHMAIRGHHCTHIGTKASKWFLHKRRFSDLTSEALPTPWLVQCLRDGSFSAEAISFSQAAGSVGPHLILPCNHEKMSFL